MGIRKIGKDGRREKSLTKCASHLSSVCQLAPTADMDCKVLVGAPWVLTYRSLLDRLSGGPTCCELAKSTPGGFSQGASHLLREPATLSVGLGMPQEIGSYMTQHLP